MSDTDKNAGFQVAQILEELGGVCLSLDADNTSAEIAYTDQDAMNALIIFMHVTSNVSIHRNIRDGMLPQKQIGLHIRHAEILRSIFTDITGIDPRQFYKSP